MKMRQGGGGNRTERRGAFHTPHWVWKQRRTAIVKSLCCSLLRYAGRETRGHRWEINMTHHWKLEKQDKCHYQFRLSFFLTFIYSDWGFSLPLMFVCRVMSAHTLSNWKRIPNINGTLVCCCFLGFGMSQLIDTETPVHFLG